MTVPVQVLYVDDERALLDITQLYLERDHEFSVTTSISAGEALRFLAENRVDAIISDYQMPGMDGISFLKILRDQGDQTPFIIFTGKGREEVVIEALNIGADSYIQKGGEPRSQFAELAHKVRNAVSKRRVEAALHESERRYHDLYHFAGVALFEVRHADATLVACNKIYCELFGFSSVEEALGQSIDQFYTNPDDRETMVRVFGEQGFIKDHVARFRNRQTGRLFWAQLSARYVAGRDISEGSVIDITERVETEQALFESREHLDAAQKLGHLGSWTYTLSDGKIRWTEETFRIYGRNPAQGEPDFQTLTGLFHPDDRAGFIATVNDAVEQGISYEKEWRVLLPEGDLRYIRAQGQAVRNNGKTSRLWGTVLDITGMKEVETALRDSEERYRALVDHALDPMLIVDFSGTILFANHAAAALAGLDTPEVAIGRNATRFLAPGSREAVIRDLASVKSGKDAYIAEYQVVTASGMVRWVEAVGKKISYQGMPADLVMLRDITDRKQVEQQVQEREEQYRTLTANLPGIVYRVHLKEGRMQFFNDQLTALTGYREPELIRGKVCSIDPLIHPDDRAEVVAAVTRAIMDKTSFSVQYRLVHKDGSIRHFRERGRILTGNDGKPLYIDGTIDDFTEQKQHEAALRQSEDRYRSLAEASPDLIFIVDRNDMVQYVNEYAARQLHKPAAQIVGMPRTALFPAAVADRQTPYLQNIFSTGIPFRGESRVPFNGRDIWIDTCIVPLKDDSGNIPALLGISRDVTDRKRYEEALREANRKQSLLSSITRHDILNQLTVLQSYLDLSRDQHNNPPVHDEYIRRAERAAAIIEEQIRFTKDYQDIGIGTPVWHDVRSNIELAHARLPMRAIRLDANCTGLEIFADPLFEKVFYNLIDNALKHGGDLMTTVRVFFSECEDGFTLVCEDDGVGIPDDDKIRLFTKGYGKNTGLGLFLVREILGITGITITENGAPGKGARFEMQVPVGGYRLTG